LSLTDSEPVRFRLLLTISTPLIFCARRSLVLWNMCTSNPHPTDSDMCESKYKFKKTYFAATRLSRLSTFYENGRRQPPLETYGSVRSQLVLDADHFTISKACTLGNLWLSRQYAWPCFFSIQVMILSTTEWQLSYPSLKANQNQVWYADYWKSALCDMFFAGRAPPHPPSLIFKLPRPRSAGDKSDFLFLNIGRRQAFVLHTSFFRMFWTEHFLKWAFNRIRRRNFCGTPFFGGGVGGP